MTSTARGTCRASSDCASTQSPSVPLGPWCVVAAAWAFRGREDVVATPGRRRAPGPWLLLGGLGEATLAILQADAPHPAGAVAGNGRSRRRCRIAGSRQIW
jgi:hypothetical protein